MFSVSGTRRVCWIVRPPPGEHMTVMSEKQPGYSVVSTVQCTQGENGGIGHHQARELPFEYVAV